MNNNNLTPQEDGIVRNAAGGDVHAAAVARLYTTTDNSWSYDGIWGGLALVSFGGSRYLRLINLSSSEIVWEHELYENISYTSPKPFFHTFEGADSVIGLSFADEEDANKFISAVNSHGALASHMVSPRRPSMPTTPKTGPPPRPSGSPAAAPSIAVSAPGPSPPTGVSTPMPSPSVNKPAPSTPSTPAAKVSASAPAPKAKGSGIGGAKKWFSKIKIFGDSGSNEEIAISQPREFRHESHIGWDPSNGFEIRNIPPQWRKLFQAAGIKKSELRDAETAKFIMDTVAEATMGSNPVAAPAGGPPPPSNAPPPPSGGPPPPAGAPEAIGAPSAGGPPVPARGGGPPPAASGGMLAGLQSVKLKSAEERPVPNLGEIPEDKQATLADTLAKAMEARRDAFQEDSDDAASDDEWSD